MLNGEFSKLNINTFLLISKNSIFIDNQGDYMKSLQQKIEEYFVNGLVCFTAGWCVLALLIQMFFVVLHFSGNDDIARKVSNEIEVRIDGRFSNDSQSFWN